jgi:cytochrome b6-f complex iron-sulfur subunit
MSEKEKKSKFSLTRGQFLSLAWVGTVALVVGEAIFALAKYIQPVSTGGFGGEVLAGKVNEFPLETVTYILSGRFYLVHNVDGLIALWQKCTHLGCAVPWVENEDQFHCPCHGSLYSPNGVVQGGPAPRPLDIFPIEIRGDEVWVDTSKPTQRSGYDPSQAVPV